MKEETRIWKLDLDATSAARFEARLISEHTKVEQEIINDLWPRGFLVIEITIKHYPEGKP